MTDPAQVTEQVSGGAWAALGAVVGTAISALAMLFSKRTEAAAQVVETRAEERVELEREDTARMQIRAEFDRGAFERAFEDKSAEHRECREEVRLLRIDVSHLRDEIAECRKDHELRDAFEAWVRENAKVKTGAEPPPPPRVRAPTPANGTDIVRPVRKDPRRDP